MSSNKRRRITIDTKASIIEAVEKKNRTNAQICRDFDIPSSTLYTILKEKEKIMKAQSSGDFMGDRKRIRRPDFADVDQALLVYFKQARAQRVPISGPQLMVKGKELADALGISNFSMSQGWLDRFKQRHGIGMKAICGESSSVDTSTIDDWKRDTLQPLIREYRPCDIFNADETGLFYKCLPSRTLAFKGETCSGGKIPKERITMLVAANMDGSEKLPLLIIGKFEKPRCMKNVKSLPTTYRANKKAWMTAKLFEEWVRKLDRKFLLQGRSVALLVDNCTAHPDLSDLKAIKLVFLPPNTTSVLQPCDQGIIQNLKTLYRKRIMKRLVAAIDSGEGSNHLNMTILDAMTTAAFAWDEVKVETVANCFRHAGFCIIEDEASPAQPVEGTTNAIDDEVVQLFNKLRDLNQADCSIEEYLSVDENTESTEILSTQDIVDSIATREEDEATTAEVDEDEIQPKVSTKAAMDYLASLQTFLLQQENAEDLIKGLDKYCTFVHNAAVYSRKQTTITSFFKPPLP